MKKRSLRRYLYFHFLILIFLLLGLFLMLVGIYPVEKTQTAYSATRYQAVLLLLFCVVILFVMISGLFFYRLHKRLLPLQKAMEVATKNSTIPQKISIKKGKIDEIAQLEFAFNQMSQQLKESYQKEKEEEKLRQKLIADISHDIRTPLTVLRGQTAQLERENLSEKGKLTLTSLNQTISYIGELVNNLLDYSLLQAGKYPYHPQVVNIVRLVRVAVASWYPTFEQKDFRIDVCLPENHSFTWEVDPQWFNRVLNNIFQNVLRHASAGKYLAIFLDFKTEQLTIKDHGPGMGHLSANQGLGIGLTVSRYMLEQMSLEINFVSSKHGTSVQISKKLD
ncbi:HAMP domain-containing sensor histidine kinase [Lactobacillus sp. ESL0791]|uniref:sensor histidine kinase n=1 Tax=Lactobacillus sp. ESL0791 TaxID=2983234 RepID=UPI0023F91BB9|nr:HAMP domain-containing sensor histidine kinase [Lactobacillus sp. ESL0791]MDF7639886.1 HAMP domain-containing sensor histidine kinase [Lactobacillus sp. ESL0791]